MLLNQQIIDDLQWSLLEHVRQVVYQVQKVNDEEIIRKMPITYGALIARTPHSLPPNGIGAHLTAIGDRCSENGNPRLDVLVVSKRTKRPGKAVTEGAWRREVLECFHCESYRRLTEPSS